MQADDAAPCSRVPTAGHVPAVSRRLEMHGRIVEQRPLQRRSEKTLLRRRDGRVGPRSPRGGPRNSDSAPRASPAARAQAAAVPGSQQEQHGEGHRAARHVDAQQPPHGFPDHLRRRRPWAALQARRRGRRWKWSGPDANCKGGRSPHAVRQQDHGDHRADLQSGICIGLRAAAGTHAGERCSMSAAAARPHCPQPRLGRGGVLGLWRTAVATQSMCRPARQPAVAVTAKLRRRRRVPCRRPVRAASQRSACFLGFAA